MIIWSDSSKIYPVLTCVGYVVDMDLYPSGGTPVVINGRGRSILTFMLLADDGWGGVDFLACPSQWINLYIKIKKKRLQKGSYIGSYGKIKV